MALVPCSNCGDSISAQADYCPHCFFKFALGSDGVVIPERPIKLNDLWTTYKALLSEQWIGLLLRFAIYGAAWFGLVMLTLVNFVKLPHQYLQLLVLAGSLAAWPIMVLGVPTLMLGYIRKALGVKSPTSGGFVALPQDALKSILITAPVVLAISLGATVLVIPGLIVAGALWCAPYLFVHENLGFGDAFRRSIALFKTQGTTMFAACTIAALIMPASGAIGVVVASFFTDEVSFLFLFGLVGGFMLWTWSGAVLTAFIHPEIVVHAGVSEQFSPVSDLEHAPTKAASDSSSSPHERLKSLNELRDSGLINEADFERKKLEILSEL